MYLISFFLFSIIALSVVRVGVVNSISTTGEELATLETQIKDVKKQNTILEEQYLALSSLTNIEEKAKQLGFIEAKSQLYLSTPLPLALKQ